MGTFSFFHDAEITALWVASIHKAQNSKKESTMSDEMSTPYLLALLSERASEIQKMVQKLRQQDSEYREWTGYDAEITLRRLDWLNKLAESRMECLLKRRRLNH